MKKDPDTAKEKAAAHEKRKTRMRILTMSNDGDGKLKQMGTRALASGSANARRGMLAMMEEDSPKKIKKRNKSRDRSKDGPEMGM